MRWVLAATVALTLAGTGQAAEPYRDTAHKFALDVPDGWEVMQPRDLAAFNAASSRRNRTPSVAGLRPAGTVGIPVRGKHPVVLVAAIPIDQAELSFAEFEKDMTRVFTDEHLFGPGGLRSPLAFDEPRRRATMQCQDDTLAVYSVASLGKDEVILVNCLCERRSYETHLPTFRALADSFRFDADAVPPAPPRPPSALDRVLGPLGPTGRMAAIGAAVGLGVLLVGAVLTRGGQQSRRRDPY